MLRFTRRTTCAASLLVAGLSGSTAAATPSSPAIEFGYDLAGQPGNVTGVVGISQDGSEVLFNHLPTAQSSDTELLARNLRTNVTKRVLSTGSPAWSASANNQRVLFQTADALDPADRNTSKDFYVLDRVTGASTLASRKPGGLAIGLNASVWNAAALSGDGNSVVYDYVNGTSQWVMRYALATGKVTLVGPGPLTSDGRLDTAGTEVMTGAGLVANGATIPIPFTPPTGYRHTTRRFRFAPDGSAMAEERSKPGGADVIVTDARSGAQTTFPLPPTAAGTTLHLLGVSDGGGSILVARGITDAATGGDADEVDRVTAAGAVTPIATLPSFAARGARAIMSADGALVADAQLFKIGESTGAGPVPVPIPPVANPVTAASRYTPYYPGCSAGNVFAPAIRPSVVLSATAVAPSAKVPASAVVKVTVDSSLAVAGTYTLKPGARQSLAGGWGGFVIETTVTFTDGSKATGSQHIDPYAPMVNDTNPFSSTKGACKVANGL